MESSSHGLDQHRLWGVKYYVAVATNITHDHLDYHKTYENYLAAKAKLFRGAKIAILNRDDRSYEYLNSKFEIRNSKLVTYGIKNQADFAPQTFSFKTKLPGEYNQYNCLAAVATTSSLGISPEKIRRGIASFKGIVGRMEEIKERQNFRIVIDFAKTASGLENVLTTLNSQLVTRNRKTGKLIVVFGSAGLRDIQKREMMGEVAGRLADISILTTEDPRTEDVNKIIEQIAQGCRRVGGRELAFYYDDTYHHSEGGRGFIKVPNRREAIRLAMRIARKGDIVVLCGKGHERSMCIGKKEYPWNEHAEVRRALKNLRKHA